MIVKVLYQGTLPRSSRSSVEPIHATITAAAGPPRAATTSVGAEVTLTIAPRGVRTGKANAANDTAIQNSSPGVLPPGPSNAGGTGSIIHETTVKQTDAVMTARSSSFKDAVTAVATHGGKTSMEAPVAPPYWNYGTYSVLIPTTSPHAVFMFGPISPSSIPPTPSMREPTCDHGSVGCTSRSASP